MGEDQLTILQIAISIGTIIIGSTGLMTWVGKWLLGNNQKHFDAALGQNAINFSKDLDNHSLRSQLASQETIHKIDMMQSSVNQVTKDLKFFSEDHDRTKRDLDKIDSRVTTMEAKKA